MKFLAQAVFLFIISTLSISAQQRGLPRFEKYKTPLYKGKTHLPKGLSRGSNNEWRDELGKLVQSPEINFAGKYFVAVHSCGTGCRYYTLTDLSSGRELKTLDGFTTAEPLPKTSDGYAYLTLLYNRFDSKMLVAQYEVDLRQGKSQCRERAFLFENEKLKPISATKYKCRKF
jgi:hypothetical protein